MCKLLVGILNIYEADRGKGRIQSLGGAKGIYGCREEIGRDRVSPLIDNDSPKSQIKAWTTSSIMLKPPRGFVNESKRERSWRG